MNLIKIDKNQRKILLVLTYVLILFGAYFLRNYLMLMIFSAIIAVLFNPIYSWFLKKNKSPGSASFYTFCISVLALIIPLVIVGSITFYQVQSIITTIADQNYTINATGIGNEIVNLINDIFAKIGIDQTISIDEIANALSNAAATLSRELFNDVVGLFSGLFGFITAAIIYIYVFLSMLKNRKTIIETIKKLNPLGDEVSNLYLDRVTAMTKATVRGQFIIAFMQGLASAIVLGLVGPSGLFFFWLLLLTVMSVIPLGAGIITIPVGIVMILTGNVFGGVLVIANHLLIVTNIDNVMRPRLVPRSARLDPALMILAVFSGIAIYGFLGIVIGPIIMIIIVTTLLVFNEVFYKEESIDRSKEKKKIGTFTKIKNKIQNI
jgi:predicted PurR-regulated permease PerM